MILAFSGGLGSGKSSLSLEVAGSLGWPRTSFGGYVRSVAKERSLCDTREVLQELGEELLRNMGPQAFSTATLALIDWAPGDSIVLDGVRHRDVLFALRELDDVRLVFIAADQVTRVRRLRTAGRLPNDLEHVEQHSTELEVEQFLRSLADLVVNGNDPLPALVDEIVFWLEREC